MLTSVCSREIFPGKIPLTHQIIAALTPPGGTLLLQQKALLGATTIGQSIRERKLKRCAIMLDQHIEDLKLA